METISGEKFKEIICSNEAQKIENYLVQIERPLNIDLGKVNLGIFFSTIKFSGKQVRFYNYQKECLHRFKFEECIFESNIFFESNFEDILFIANTFDCDKFEISNSEIGVLQFDNSPINEKTNIFNKGIFKIHNCDFNSIFWIKNVQLLENTNIDISSVKFLEGCFFDSTLLNKIMFYNCEFLKEFRYECNYNLSQFSECYFSGLTTFGGLLNINSSFLYFDHCTFSKLANFNNYWLHKLRLEDTKFLDNVSFQQTYFDIIIIVRTIFEKNVWFDDIQIKKIDDCDRSTIRTIKQELQKVDNKIDYNRFRIYEFNAYRKDIRKKMIEFKKDKNRFYHRKREPIQLKRDLFILDVSDIVSEYGTDWKRALKFTLLSGFTAFSLFFYIRKHKINS